MDKITHDLWNWPLWCQLLLLIVLGLVTHFWVGRLLGSMHKIQATGWKSSRLWHFMQCLFWAGIVSWLAVRFCIGKNGQGNPYAWGFYGRVLFVGFTAYLTNLFTRYFS